jgi:hypothetical protein
MLNSDWRRGNQADFNIKNKEEWLMMEPSLIQECPEITPEEKSDGTLHTK